ncbi:MAG: sensor histidine kinase [Bacteroidia bacterium]|nr:sensor histidine kinase [Bacteroidia bacterium]
MILIGIAVDLVLIYRRKKLAAEQERRAHMVEVDRLLQRHEVESVNALLQGQDEERMRIARELHDSLGSLLFTAKLHYSQMEKQVTSLLEQNQVSHGEVHGLLDQAVDEVRRISHDLYEGSLAQFGYKTALVQLINAIESTNSIRIEFDDGSIDPGMIVAIQKDLYRITQELLSNTLKYAKASVASIAIHYDEAEFMFTYEDDGVGWSKEESEFSEGIGIKNIRARAKAIGGQLTIDGRKGVGMKCTLKIVNDNDNN